MSDLERTFTTAVLFDLDGTLLDTAYDFVAVVQELCKRHHITPPLEKDIRSTVSDGARALVSLAFQLAEGDNGFEDLRQELLDIYEQQLGHNTLIFNGIEDTLKVIESLGISWGVVTNKPRRFAEPLMQHMNLQPALGVLVCPDDVEHAKPHPQSLHKAASFVGSSSANCLYVGDHARDIEAGKNAGMLTVAAAYGYVSARAEAEAWAADYIVDSAYELTSIIRNFHQTCTSS
ncbi:MAG: HAD family hydrolase [Pseudomonadales bacterium]